MKSEVIAPPPRRQEVSPGRALRIQQIGEAGPWAFFDSGAFGIYADGSWVADALAARGHRVLLYTRAGLEGADAVPAGAVPDPFFHAEDMARLMDSVGVTEPVLMLGHSMAGLRLRAFASLFPARLSGLIFIDAVTPAQLGWTVRRELVRTGCRMISVCGSAAESPVGRRALRLYPNNIGLVGQARDDKVASLTSARHLAGTRAEMLASTESGLKARLAPLPDIPAGAVTATIVARGTKAEPMERLHIPRTGHAEILRPEPAGRIADFALKVTGGVPAALVPVKKG